MLLSPLKWQVRGSRLDKPTFYLRCSVLLLCTDHYCSGSFHPWEMLLSRASTLGASSIEGDESDGNGEDHHRQGSLVAVGTGKRSAPQIRRGVDTCTATAARRRKRLLKDAAKISMGDGEPLKRYLGLVTCVQASEILKVCARLETSMV